MLYLLQTCSTMKDLIKVCFLSLPFLIWCSFNIIICDTNIKYWSYTKLDVNHFVNGWGINFLVCYLQYDKHDNEYIT